MPLRPGSTFERYTIESLVGRGGMGEVYKALDTRLHRPVALKVLRADRESGEGDAGGVARLLREARAAAALSHPNSVAIYELGEAEGIPYIAMEFVRGRSFRRYVEDRQVSIETKVAWLVDAARALWAAHRAGLVHRDVKPGNIMVSEEGIVKVLDFGLAKPVARHLDVPGFQTAMGQVVGTPRYMAPEQLEGATADAMADQFAFGLTAYELLSGVYPGGPLAGAPARLDAIVPEASAALADVVARMMARKPSDRFPTMEAAAHALRTCAPSARMQRSGRAADQAPSSEPPTQARPLERSGAVPISPETPLAALPHTLPLTGTGELGAAIARASNGGGASLHARRPTTGTVPLATELGVKLPARPLAQPATPQESPTASPSTPGVASGVYLAGDRPRGASGATSPAREPGARSTGSWRLGFALLAIGAIAAGGPLAWLMH